MIFQVNGMVDATVERCETVAQNIIHEYLSFPGGSDGKESAFNAGDLC